MDGLKLLEPITVGRLRLRNRIVMPPMGTDYALPDGSPSPRHFSYLVARARGGVGLILCEGARVNKTVASPGRFHLHDDTLIPRFRSLTEAVHAHGAKIGIQLGHPGRQTTSAAMGGLQPVAPSPIPCPVCREMPHELTREEIKALVKDFAQAAQRAQRAGFDLVELHGAHGYLISQFFSPHTNQRRDEYGGDVAGRCRFAVEIVRRIKERLGPGFPVAVRFNGSDFIAG
ncbi:MAG: NADH:flavin oxidoreductase, partial [Chloroflexota bacterium]|nr:NADH:flavin oxidoreductase [Chloroflexota bacterium]